MYKGLWCYFTIGLVCASCGGSATLSDDQNGDDDDDRIQTECDNSGIPTFGYLIAFHACASECTSPINHTIYLAGSNDGIQWTLIDAFAGLAGSVPDLVFFNNFLTIFHTGQKSWAKVNACFEIVEEGEASLVSNEDTGSFVDPSLIVAGDDLILFYLPGIIGQDPAGCTAYPCTKEIHSAQADDEMLASFTQIAGNRAEAVLSAGSFSDPDIVARADGSFLLYVSSGQSTSVFTGSSLNDTFASPDGQDLRLISNNAGGVPTAIEVNNEIWLYVTTSASDLEVIRRAVSSDGITTLQEADFATVINSSIASQFSATTNVSSPSVITWPSGNWSKQAAE